MSDDLLSPDEVRSAVRSYFADHPGLDEARSLRDGAPDGDEPGFDRGRWRTLAEEVGLVGMAAPEEADGLGLGLEHVVAAAEEAAACLYPGPLRASVLAAWALGLGGPLSEDLLGHAAGLLSGAVVVGMPQAFASQEPGPVLDPEGRVSGTVRHVTHGMTADALLAVAAGPRGPAVVLVPLAPDADGRARVTRRPVRSVDLTARLGDLHLDAAPAVPMTAPGDTAAVARLGDVARLLLAAEQVGGAQGCLGHMVEYAKIRSQFGQVIGAYQAIQHRCAEVAVAVTAARALVLAAAGATDAGDHEQAHRIVLLAKAEASEAFAAAADTLVQVHGGVGFTWEHDAHLYFRRARAAAALDGRPARLRDAAAAAGCLSLLTGAAESRRTTEGGQ
ncbi:acyl-CoA dehydrogenase family protein [Microtetraspora niveoalba]|uniref:acyl-CoA dehydrogenase family protein n=1 Tax=Microtetraspora niveoalba TaxID=46175 RepID=UPI000AA7EAB1|nr:acyl-CoA dehydrogenase family protein [Microtetraspora niveoalba]